MEAETGRMSGSWPSDGEKENFPGRENRTAQTKALRQESPWEGVAGM